MISKASRLGNFFAWRPGAYLRSSGVLFAWLAVRTLAQAALFVLVARTLGADGYGALISAMALAGIFSYAVMGASAVMVREGARDPHRLPRLTRDMGRLWLLYMPVLCVMAAATTQWLVGLHWTPATWAFGYLASSAGYLLLLLLAATSKRRRATGSDTPLAQVIKASLPFSFYYAAQKVQAEINKPMLARINDASGAGTLSAAQRFTDLLLLPVLAMLETLAPRVYRAPKPISTAFTLGLVPFATAVLGGGALLAGANAIPWILGPSFQPSVSAVVMLAALPAVQVLRWLLSTAMTGLDLHRHFYFVHGTGAVTNIVLVASLAAAFGLTGAVWAAYGTEAVLIVIQGWILLRANKGLKLSSRLARSLS